MSEKKVGHNIKKDFLKNPVEHIQLPLGAQLVWQQTR